MENQKKISDSKQFTDTKYQNFSLQNGSNKADLNQITKILSEGGAKLTFIKSCNYMIAGDIHTYQISTQTLSKDKIKCLTDQFKCIGVKFTQDPPILVPWFPRCIDDLNKMGYADLKNQPIEDHLVYDDYDYKKKRDEIAEIANNHKMGDKIPQVTYEEGQHALWREVYAHLRSLQKEGMCEWYNKEAANMEKQINISQGIPSLEVASQFMFKRTGFRIKPIHSIIGTRQFFNCYAFRVFPCAQYFRHQKTPPNTPYIDILHETIGHFVLFSHPEIAELAQLIGILSLGSTDAQLEEIAALFWYTIQFGFLNQNGKHRSYGGGPATSVPDLEHSQTKEAKFKNLDVYVDSNTPVQRKFPQEIYYVVQSVGQAIKDIKEFAKSITKPIQTLYNRETNKIEYNRNWLACTECGIKDYKM